MDYHRLLINQPEFIEARQLAPRLRVHAFGGMNHKGPVRRLAPMKIADIRREIERMRPCEFADDADWKVRTCEHSLEWIVMGDRGHSAQQITNSAPEETHWPRNRAVFSYRR